MKQFLGYREQKPESASKATGLSYIGRSPIKIIPFIEHEGSKQHSSLYIK